MNRLFFLFSCCLSRHTSTYSHTLDKYRRLIGYRCWKENPLYRNRGKMPRAAAVSLRSVSSSMSCSSRHRIPLSQRRSVSSSCFSSSKRVSRRLLSLTLPLSPSLLVVLGSTSAAVAEEEKLQLSSRQRAAQLDGLTQLAYQKIAENHVRI